MSTKIRPVFDASAGGPNGVSLNDVVEVGPPLMPNMLTVLLRFRRWRFGICADIVKAFHQIKIATCDQDAHRFFWRRGERTRVMRFERVVMGVACSPFLLNATVKHHLSLYPGSPVVGELIESLYADDWLSGCDSEQSAVSMLAEARAIMGAAGMELAKCSSNSPVLLDKLQLQGQQHPTSETTRVLGVTWCREDDTLSFAGDQLQRGLCRQSE